MNVVSCVLNTTKRVLGVFGIELGDTCVEKYFALENNNLVKEFELVFDKVFILIFIFV